MSAAYFLEFELTYNTWTDLTADWQARDPLVIERGMEPGERSARTGTMRLALHNPDGRYTPGHAECVPGFDAGIGVRLRASDGVDTHTLFYGRLASITVVQSVGSRRSITDATEITVEDDIAVLERLPIGAFPLMIDAAPGEVINALVDRAFTPPGLFGYWRLGHPQQALLGSTTLLPETFTGKDLDAGQSIFAWVGDVWSDGARRDGAVRDVCASEGGTFHITADGTPTFADRQARPKHVAPDAVLSARLTGVRVERAERRIANSLTATVHPRTVGTPGAELWQAGSSIRLVYGQPQVITARYRDPDLPGAYIGALDLIRPVAGIDYTATNHLNGSGSDRSAEVHISVEQGASSARLTLERTLSKHPREPIYIHALRLRGTPLRAFYPVTITQTTDDASFFAHGHRPLSLDMPLQDEAAVARDMATALLANRKDPHPWLTVTVEAAASASLLAHALARDVGDRLHLTDLDVGLDEVACFIDGIRHEISEGRHRVTWRTTPADLETYWLLGSSTSAALGEASRLGY
jgi:hypothetical protein